MAVKVTIIPQHCGNEMQVTRAKFICPVCLKITKTHPLEQPNENNVPKHCENNMDVVRSLKCDACGYETSETLSMQV